jgi:hypothetical protein|tara:strand:+ start:1900 stop:2730 length:831 start_codon:yes stop_codon:yes gene_type:complete
MPKITGLGAGVAPANADVLVLVSNTAGTANTQKVTVNTFFSNVTANVKFANAEITLANVQNGVVNASAVTATTVKGTTSVQTPLIEFTDGDDAITIADGGGVTIPDLTATTADINGGTIDGATIGDTTPVTIYATGGNLQGVDVGTSSQAVGTFTNLTSLANTDLQGGLTIGHEEVTSNGAISTYIPLTILKGGSGEVVATLANSANMGQIKIITAYHTNATTSLEVASTLGAGDTYTFQTSGETIMLIWTGDHWALISKSGNPTGSNLAGTMDVT